MSKISSSFFSQKLPVTFSVLHWAGPQNWRSRYSCYHWYKICENFSRNARAI